jgi:malate dehydrogenase (oxaloacetate-decarboxylating)(NADP+)
MTDSFKQAALDYHEFPRPGKVEVTFTKPADTQEDLSLAYSPGVAEPVLAIHEDPANVYRYTNKGNLVGVITNGTAILGLGNLGPLASKPVMEGKGMLFKKFADIDVFDIEVDAKSESAFVEAVMAIAPTFGGINLEDIKAPECFGIESELKQRLNIPVFHDDQHGTAIIIAAGLLNALELQGKHLATAKIVCLGAGAAGIAGMQFLVRLGALRENIFMLDREGIIHIERYGLGPHKFAFARKTDKRTLAEALEGADVFIGVSGPNLVKAEEIALMADKPIIFALSNPVPEIHPDLIRQVRSDAIIATGRSDLPNQVNNALCFPYIFRGALDVRARVITTSMCIAAMEALRDLVKLPVGPEMHAVYPAESLIYGPDYIIPKPFDPRLREMVSSRVSAAAVKAGVAALPLPKKSMV